MLITHALLIWCVIIAAVVALTHFKLQRTGKAALVSKPGDNYARVVCFWGAKVQQGRGI